MYRVIIADDEPWIVYSLVHSIDWEALGFTICATAENGPQALENCLSLQPDVLFSDIRMPGLDGLELLEKLRKELPDIEVVFISGYAEFSYAQQAVRHGAADYLIKQVSAKQLTDTLVRLKERLEQKAGSTLNDIYFALLDEDDTLSVAEWAKYCAHYRSYPHFRFITFSAKELEEVYWMKECWTPEFGQLLLRTGRNKYSALVGYSSEDGYLNWIARLTEKNTGHIGISKEVSENYPFTSLHRQADIAFYTAMMAGTDSALTYSREYPYGSEQQITEYIRLFEEDLKNNDINMCAPLLMQIGLLCKGLMLDRAADIFNQLLGLFKRYRPLDADALEACSCRRLATEFPSIEAAFDFLKQNLQTSENSNLTEFLGQNILQYIDAHYTEDLRLPDLAARYHFSPSYFSTLFKKHTGTTLTRYVTAKRIALAKSLLNESDISIQEVVERIGYNDYFQFIKVFKREVGITPGHYRNK